MWWKPKKLPNNIPDKDLVWNIEIIRALGIRGKMLYEWKKTLDENGGTIPYRQGVKMVIEQARENPKLKLLVGFVKLAKYLDVFIDNQPSKKDPK